MGEISEMILTSKINHLDTKVDELGEGFSYKGSVANIAALPASGTLGDMYTVVSESNARYVWNGTAWVKAVVGSDANSVDYSSSATYRDGTVGKALTSQSSQIDDLEDDKAEKTALALTDKKLDYLAALTKGQAWSESTGTTPAYQHTVAKGAKAVEVKKIGGKTIKYNQLCENGNFESERRWYSGWSQAGTISIANNELTLSALSSKTKADIYKSGSFPTSTYLICYKAKDSNAAARVNTRLTNASFGAEKSLSASYQTIEYFLSNNDGNLQILFSNITNSVVVKDVNVFDLTAMGADSTVTDLATAKSFLTSLGVDYTQYNPYSANTLLSADVTAVTSKEDDGTTTMGTLSIPSAVRALEGYGESNTDDSTQYNYVDFTNKKYIEVGHYVDGVWTAHAQEIDISSYIGDDNLLDVEYNGTVTFTQANTVGSTSVDVRIPVPNGTTYMINNSEATT